MTHVEMTFWIVAIAGTGAAAWWLTVRPGQSPRHVAAPVAILTLVLAVLLSFLAMRPDQRPFLRSEVVTLVRGY